MEYSVRNKKTLNSTRNLITGIMVKIIETIAPFFVRTVLIYKLGEAYNGLNSLFTSILQVLNMAELGVGSALIFSMYKPVNEGDNTKLCALTKLYKIYYRIIGFIILIIGCMLTPFLQFLIKGDIPSDLNLYILYFLNLGTTVLSYWLFSYRNCLFNAYQRGDVVNKVTFCINIIKYSLQIIVLIIIKNYYYYLIISLISQILINLVVAFFSKKYFPDIKPIGKLDISEKKKINGTIKDIFTSQVGLIVTNSVDSIVISAFLGLITLSTYQNYYYIFSSIVGFFTIFYNSIRASIGNNLLNKNMESNYEDFKFINFIVFALLTFSISCLYGLYQPFMKKWVGVENMLGNLYVILFGIYLLVYEVSISLATYKDAAGKWHYDRLRPLITALINLVTNIILVNIIGVYGIILSTILSFLFINLPWLYKRVFIDVFEKKYSLPFLHFFLLNILKILIISACCYIVCYYISMHNLVLEIFIKLIICSFISVILFILFNLKSPYLKKIFNLILVGFQKIKNKL